MDVRRCGGAQSAAFDKGGRNEKSGNARARRRDELDFALCRGGGDAEPSALIYFKAPLGAWSRKEQRPVFGLMLRSTTPEKFSAVQNPLLLPPVADIQFTTAGLRSINVLGLNPYRLNAAGELASSEQSDINWWIVGGFGVAAALLIRNSNRKDNGAQFHSFGTF
ncbi:MAG: hypothetical protein HY322_02560 [Betaproteobacteria bacterium]|nr:hypothetical protein [Betaproteobacteria bacterium]